MENRSHKALVRRFVEEILNRNDNSRIEELVAPELAARMREPVDLFPILSKLPGLRFQIDREVEQGDVIVVQGRWMGIGPGNGAVELPAVAVLRFRDGRIAESSTNFDVQDLVRRLGRTSTDSTAPEPPLDTFEIQGNILPGFAKDHQFLVFLDIVDLAKAKTWLRRSARRVATLAEAMQLRRLFKAMRDRRGADEGSIRATWMNIALSFSGLRKLAPEAELIGDVAFKEGMRGRRKYLGDTGDPRSPGSGHNWVVGANGEPDLMVLIAGDSRDHAAREVELLLAEVDGAFRIVFREEGAVLPPPYTGREHFGFADGISQPGVRGRLSGKKDDFLTLRQNPANVNHGKPGQELIWPGEFVFGYPLQDAAELVRPGPIADGGVSWMKNGSFLVFRRYRQDVEAFSRFLRDASDALSRNLPAFARLTPEKLGAKLVGRWRSGAPLPLAPDADDENLGRDSAANNDFELDDDASGVVCPHAAHMRRTNPRSDPVAGGLAEVQTHRLLRRGIPFGKPYPAPGDRGLLFLAYCTSIERQFEFVVQNWINDPKFGDEYAGHDPLIGQAAEAPDRRRRFGLRVRLLDGRVHRSDIEISREWVFPTGGGYFFSPSVSALEELARR